MERKMWLKGRKLHWIYHLISLFCLHTHFQDLLRLVGKSWCINYSKMWQMPSKQTWPFSNIKCVQCCLQGCHVCLLQYRELWACFSVKLLTITVRCMMCFLFLGGLFLRHSWIFGPMSPVQQNKNCLVCPVAGSILNPVPSIPSFSP